MARYIDAEALTDYMLERYNDLCEKHGDYDHYTTGYGDAIDVIEVAPTADVVPKSEVENLKLEYAGFEGATKQIIKGLKEEIVNAKNEVAREIFEEIEKVILDNTYPDFNAKHKPVNVWKATTGYDAFYELKKKYTGEKK